MSESVNVPPVPVDMEAMKARFLAAYNQAFSQFMQTISTIPGHTVLMHRAMAHFDDGSLNFEKAISMLQPKPVEPKPQAPVAPSKSKTKPSKAKKKSR